jgi:hypothetical protein
MAPPRITAETYAWLKDMSAETGLSVPLLVSALLDHARAEGWIVAPLTVHHGETDGAE